MAPLVIVGAGMAGYALARELRQRDAAAEILLLTGDAGEAYAKPMLSNAIAAGKRPSELVTADAARMAATLGIRVRAHCPVRAIDRAAREVVTGDGRQRYGKLVLALGAAPVRLALAGDAAGELMSVNHIDDYRALRGRLAAAGAGARVAILGAGLIGCELADDLLAGGNHVTLVDPNPRPLAALAAPALSTALAAAWEGRALVLRLQERALAVRRARPGYVLELSAGAPVQADLVVSAVGLRPATALAERAGLATARGILVDAWGRSSDPDIYALGDCAEYMLSDAPDGCPAPALLPYVSPLLAAARAIAATLAGAATRIAFKPEPVLVKTPSRKLALYPPPAGVEGEWIGERTADRVLVRFADRQGRVRGFGLSEPTAALRQAMLSELGTPLAALPG